VSEAERLFREAREDMKRQDFAVACPKLEESLKLASVAGTLLNLSECNERQGRLVMALQRQREAIKMLPADDDRLPRAKEREETLDRTTPRLVIRLPSPSPTALRIALDGSALRREEVAGPVPLDPGTHTLLVAATGATTRTIRVLLNEGDRKEVVANPGPSPEVRSGGNGRTWGYVLGGVGAAGLVVAGVTGFILKDKQNTINQHCDDRKICDAQGLDAVSSGQNLAPVYVTAWIVAAAGLASGGYLLLTSDAETRRPVQVGASALPGGGGLLVDGRF
jgi:hypothetical protein